MKSKRVFQILALLILPALLLNACGSPASNQSIIATSVAETVQAQNTQQAQFTPTIPASSEPPAPISLTPPPGLTIAPPTAPSAGGNSSNFCTANASFAGETIPDGTIMDPGSVFTKIWHVTNTGTCTWDSSWKLVYLSGDLLGGTPGGYNLPYAAPGQTVDVPIVLTAPQNGGTYTGYWEFQSKWGTPFGFGDSNAPASVSIVVGSGTPANAKTQTAYGVTAVTYSVSQSGLCSQKANIFYTIAATISSNGPITIKYYWQHSDGGKSSNKTLTFSEATSIVVSEPWAIHLGSNTGTYWDQIVVYSPTYQAFGKAYFDYVCH